jgi:single-stranded DNA-binding protein
MSRQNYSVTGNVAADPQILDSGSVVFRLIHNKRWKDANGQEVTRATQHDCYVNSDSLADVVKRYVHKGDFLTVDSTSLEPVSFKRKDGTDGVALKMQVTQLTLDPRGAERARGGSGSGGSSSSGGGSAMNFTPEQLHHIASLIAKQGAEAAQPARRGPGRKTTAPSEPVVASSEEDEAIVF